MRVRTAAAGLGSEAIAGALEWDLLAIDNSMPKFGRSTMSSATQSAVGSTNSSGGFPFLATI